MHSSILMGALECSSTSSVVPHCLRLEGALVCGAVELQPNRPVSGREPFPVSIVLLGGENPPKGGAGGLASA